MAEAVAECVDVENVNEDKPGQGLGRRASCGEGLIIIWSGS